LPPTNDDLPDGMTRLPIPFAFLLLCTPVAQAAPQFDWLLARHRSLSAEQLTPPAVLQAAPALDGGAAWIGSSRSLPMPLLVEGGVGSGVRVGRTLVDRPGGLRLRLGATLADVPEGSGLPRASLEGFELSAPLGVGRAYASQQRRHWGPGWMGSLVLDGAAPPIAAVGWRKDDDQPFETSWLRWLGPWSADFFFGGLAGHSRPDRPWYIGMRITAQPLPGLGIGLSRGIQWGGTGRDESFSSLFHSLIGRDNVGKSGITKANEPGNQLGGFDVRYARAIGAGRVAAVYLQAIGEDESGYLPIKYLLSAGAELSGRFAPGSGAPLAGYSWRVFGEWADTGMRHAYDTHQPGAYRSGAYPYGYTHHRQVIGYPAGGDVTLGSLGAILDGPRASVLAVLHAGRALEGAQAFTAGDRIRGLGLGFSVPWRALRLGGAVDVLEDGSTRRHYGQVWAGWRW